MVYDILSHASAPRELITGLNHIFRFCQNRNIRLSAKKCDLYLRRVTWCGRTISSEGVGYDPENMQGVKDLNIPQTVGDLQQ